MKMREEKDTMGTVLVPEDAYYGAQTQRAVENFAVSGMTLPPVFVKALGLIKKHAAQVNRELGLLEEDVAKAIITAAGEVVDGKLEDQFVVDVFQTGSGTSTNMNANEVITGRANEILTGKKGAKSPVHPNDHVNMGQSSNDVIPTAIHVAALMEMQDLLIPAMERLTAALEKKAAEFSAVRKIARTHLQDAVPMSLGEEFSGYARQLALSIRRVRATEESLAELALGGTAVGTGLNTHPEFAGRVIAGLSRETGCPFREAENHFEAQAAQDGAVEASGALRGYAVSLIKIANDIRWLSSGPRCGLGEINIPSLQPGSSIMPGKVNPVILEAVVQVGAQVIGNDAAVTMSGQAGNFELNVMLPVIAHNLLQSIALLGAVTRLLEEKCVKGITANSRRCASNLEQSLAVCTALVPAIGYDNAAAVSKAAYAQERTVREVALEMKVLPEDELNKLLDTMVYGEVSGERDE